MQTKTVDKFNWLLRLVTAITTNSFLFLLDCFFMHTIYSIVRIKSTCEYSKSFPFNQFIICFAVERHQTARIPIEYLDYLTFDKYL